MTLYVRTYVYIAEHIIIIIMGSQNIAELLYSCYIRGFILNILRISTMDLHIYVPDAMGDKIRKEFPHKGQLSEFFRQSWKNHLEKEGDRDLLLKEEKELTMRIEAVRKKIELKNQAEYNKQQEEYKKAEYNRKDKEETIKKIKNYIMELYGLNEEKAVELSKECLISVEEEETNNLFQFMEKKGFNMIEVGDKKDDK